MVADHPPDRPHLVALGGHVDHDVLTVRHGIVAVVVDAVHVADVLERRPVTPVVRGEEPLAIGHHRRPVLGDERQVGRFLGGAGALGGSEQ
jgi:hypothetical protein